MLHRSGRDRQLRRLPKFNRLKTDRCGSLPGRMPQQDDAILINGRFLMQPVTGVQRVARELLSEFDRLPASRTRTFRRSVCAT
jgi:hypothetical protein